MPLKLPKLTPTLRFSPTAWAKLLFLRDYGKTEVGGFGIAPSDDLLFVQDIQLVKQDCGFAHVAFDDESVADFFDAQVDQNCQPSQFARLWLHTHPGDSPQPSMTDEDTFDRVFGRSDWAVMFILARGGQTYCRLRFNVGPGGAIQIPVEVDYQRSFDGSDEGAWEAEYLQHVIAERPQDEFPHQPGSYQALERACQDDPFFVSDQFGPWDEFETEVGDDDQWTHEEAGNVNQYLKPEEDCAYE